MVRTLSSLKTFLVLLLTLVIAMSAATPQRVVKKIKAETTMSAATDHQNSNSENDPNDGCNTNSTEEEVDGSVALENQTHHQAFGYFLFIPADPLPMIGDSIPPLHRPPLA